MQSRIAEKECKEILVLNFAPSHFQLRTANSHSRNKCDEVSSCLKQRTQMETIVQPRICKLSSVGSFDSIMRQKTNECEGGLQALQITFVQSRVTRGVFRKKCASLAVRMPSVACFQTRLSGNGVTRSKRDLQGLLSHSWEMNQRTWNIPLTVINHRSQFSIE